jgi:putative FmdB family regulatory protein
MEGFDIMPTYEYHCSGCGKNFEMFQKISDPPAEKCPLCGGKAKRLVSGGAFSLKGSGWYKDGYSSTKPGSAEKKAKTEECCKKCEKKENCK